MTCCSPPTTVSTESSSGSPTARRSERGWCSISGPVTPPRVIQNLTAAGDQVFFVAQSDELRSALWRTDGTAKGTYAITPPGPAESFAPTSIHPGPGFLYLCNAEWGDQAGLWRSDGSSSGTTFVADVQLLAELDRQARHDARESRRESFFFRAPLRAPMTTSSGAPTARKLEPGA